jgi:hypothetical protein
LNKINVNKDIKIKVLPLNSLVLIKFLNSLCKVRVSLIHNIFIREGINQYMGGIIKSPKKILIQFIDKPKFVEGSKVENKFAIIFKLEYLLFFEF